MGSGAASLARSPKPAGAIEVKEEAERDAASGGSGGSVAVIRRSSLICALECCERLPLNAPFGESPLIDRNKD